MRDEAPTTIDVDTDSTRSSRPSESRNGRVLLISKEVMHYRVSVYNYFYRRFRESGYEFSVLTGKLQEENQRSLEFSLHRNQLVPCPLRPFDELISS